MKLKGIGIIFFVVCIFLSCETFNELLADLSSSSNSNVSRGNTETRIGPSSPVMISSNANRRADPDSANWNIEALDTARDVDYLSAVEKDVILEMNKARADPKKYAELYIKPTLRYYSGKNYSEPGQITIITQEGISAVNSCISALSSSRKAGILIPEKGIWLAAKDHAVDQSKTGETGHDGSDGSDPFQRMKRYGGGYKTAGENCAYGPNTGRDIVVQFLIDDGVPSRGHRKNIMNGAFTQTGISVQTHPQYRYCCVIDYASGYISD